MSNRWGIPKEVEAFVLDRDEKCVYCGIEFNESNQSRKSRKTWEHIVNDIRLNGSDNIALCCGSCNASKGSKELKDWLSSSYCSQKGITNKSVAMVVRKHLVE